jgi:hypothetical protein
VSGLPDRGYDGPALKGRYPITGVENFARWTGEDGLHIDPRIRTH